MLPPLTAVVPLRVLRHSLCDCKCSPGMAMIIHSPRTIYDRGEENFPVDRNILDAVGCHRAPSFSALVFPDQRSHAGDGDRHSLRATRDLKRQNQNGPET